MISGSSPPFVLAETVQESQIVSGSPVVPIVEHNQIVYQLYLLLKVYFASTVIEPLLIN